MCLFSARDKALPDLHFFNFYYLFLLRSKKITFEDTFISERKNLMEGGSVMVKGSIARPTSKIIEQVCFFLWDKIFGNVVFSTNSSSKISKADGLLLKVSKL